MSSANPEIIERQQQKLEQLARTWERHLGSGDNCALHRAVEQYRQQRLELALSAARYEEPDTTDESALLDDALREEFSKVSQIISPAERLEDFYERHPQVEQSDELSWLQTERDLMRILSLGLKPAGTPEFDQVLNAWTKLDPTQVYNYGLDQDLEASLGGLLPLATAHLLLLSGVIVDEVLKLGGEPEPSISPSP